MTFRGLLRQVLIYGSGRVTLQLLGFLMLPILTRIFAPATYGVIETITTVVAIVGVISTLSLDSAVQRSYFDYRQEQGRERSTVLGTGFVALAVWSVCLALALVLASGLLSELLFDTRRYATVLALAFVAIPLGVGVTFFQEVMRLRQQAWRYVAIGLLTGGVTVTLVLYLVAVRDLGLKGLYTAGIVGTFPGLALGAWLSRGAIRLAIDRTELRTMLRYALPLLPVAATTWVIQFADRLFILHYSTAEELGLYSLGVRLSSVLVLLVTAFGIAFVPFIFELHVRDREHERQMRARALTYLVLALAFAGVCVSVYAREFFRTVTDPAFEDAYKVVGLLCGSMIVLGVNAVTMTAISLTRETRYFARYAVYTAVVNLGLNFALIPPLGIVGAALATLVTYVLLAGLYWYRAQRLDPAPFDTRQVVTVFGFSAALVALGTVIHFESVWLSIVAKLPIVLCFPLLAWLTGSLDGALLSGVRRLRFGSGGLA